MIFCDTHRLVSSSIVIRQSSYSNKWNAEAYSQTLRGAQGTLGKKKMKECRSQRVQRIPKQINKQTNKPTKESSNLGSWGLRD